MKFIVVLFFAMLALASAQRFVPVFPVYPEYGDEEYAASLAGAPVGVYRKESGRGGFGRGDSEVSGISLGGSKVGLYGRDRY